jgi:DNA (cytosine-5)-methyltransferase 1
MGKEKLKFIDLFAGIGGFHLAMHAQGLECVFASEIDKFARLTYHENFKRRSPDLFKNGLFNEDINNIDPKNIPDFDVLCAGFPCQPFSYAGKNKGFKDKTRGTLFFSILKILEAKQPRAFLLENVKGLKSQDGGRTLGTIIESLEELGYDVHWKVLDSLNFGVPQKRERWYCVGFKKATQFRFPVGVTRTPKLSDIVDPKNKDPKLGLPVQELSMIDYHFKKATNGERIKHSHAKYEVGSKKRRHGVYSYQKPDGSLRFHIGDVAKTQIQESFYCCLGTYAPTIIYNRVPKMWDLRRKLSVQECIALQGFPKTFRFPVSENQAYKQLGNSVALPVVSAISKLLIKHLIK